MADAKITVEVAARKITYRLDPHSSVQQGMLTDLAGDGYEPATWSFFLHGIQPGQTVVDVGAHVGVFTCLAAALVGPTGKVIAVEPNGENRTALLRNLRKNKLNWVKVEKVAASDTDGQATFYQCADNDGGHALWNPAHSRINTKTKQAGKQQPIKTARLDTLLGDQPVHVLKLDIEGAEFRALKGAERILRVSHPAVIAEINWFGMKQMETDEQEVRAWMRALGYAEYWLRDHPCEAVALTPETSGQQDIAQENGPSLKPVWNLLWLPVP